MKPQTHTTQTASAQPDNVREFSDLLEATLYGDGFSKILCKEKYDSAWATANRRLLERNEQIEKVRKLTAQRDELLAALRRAGMDLQDIKTDCDSGEFEIDPQFAIDRIQAAISKATER